MAQQAGGYQAAKLEGTKLRRQQTELITSMMVGLTAAQRKAALQTALQLVSTKF